MSQQTEPEPNRVFHVTCNCGYSERFRHRHDAREVFDAHAENWSDRRCGGAKLEPKYAHPKGGIDPKKHSRLYKRICEPITTETPIMTNANPANEVLDRLESDRTPISDLGNEPLGIDDVLAYAEEFRGDNSRGECVVYPAFGPETFIFTHDKWKRPQRDPAGDARTGDNILNFWIETPTAYWYFGYDLEDPDATVPYFRWYLYGPIRMDSPDVDAVEQTLVAQEYPVCSITDTPQTVRESVRG